MEQQVIEIPTRENIIVQPSREEMLHFVDKATERSSSAARKRADEHLKIVRSQIAAYYKPAPPEEEFSHRLAKLESEDAKEIIASLSQEGISSAITIAAVILDQNPLSGEKFENNESRLIFARQVAAAGTVETDYPFISGVINDPDQLKREKKLNQKGYAHNLLLSGISTRDSRHKWSLERKLYTKYVERRYDLTDNQVEILKGLIPDVNLSQYDRVDALDPEFIAVCKSKMFENSPPKTRLGRYFEGEKVLLPDENGMMHEFTVSEQPSLDSIRLSTGHFSFSIAKGYVDRDNSPSFIGKLRGIVDLLTRVPFYKERVRSSPNQYVVQKEAGVWMTAHDLPSDQSDLLDPFFFKDKDEAKFVFHRQNGTEEIYTAIDKENKPTFTLERVGAGGARRVYRMTHINENDQKHYGATCVLVGGIVDSPIPGKTVPLRSGVVGTYQVPCIAEEESTYYFHLSDGRVIQRDGPYEYLPELTTNLSILPSDVKGPLGILNAVSSVFTPQFFLGRLALAMNKHSLAGLGLMEEEMTNIELVVRNTPPGVPLPRFKWKEKGGKRFLVPGIVYVDTCMIESSMK